MVEIFKTDDGMLTVEKNNSPSDPPSAVDLGRDVVISEPDAIDTVFSYAGVYDKTGPGTCLFCGVQTEFANRHVCTSCWNRNMMKIRAELIENSSGVISVVT